MTNNVYFVNDMPFSLAYGGKEVQLLGYKSILENSISDLKINLLNPWERFNFPSNSFLHLFGSGKWFHNLVGQARQKTDIEKIIISPTFYYDGLWKLMVGNALSRLTPLKNQFSYKRFIFERADTLVVNSRSEGDQLCKVFGRYIERKLVIIPNTIADNYSMLDDSHCFISNYNIEPGYVLSVGFLDERKNSIRMIKAYLEALPLIKRKLVLIGGGRFNDPKDAELLSRLISENKEYIIHIPFLPTGGELIKSAYFNCAFHILPSHVETPGIANLEAMSFGKNIVVGDCSPVREYFKDFAIYCDSTSVASIVSAIYQANDFLISGTSDEISSHVYRNFTHASICDKLVNLYSS